MPTLPCHNVRRLSACSLPGTIRDLVMVPTPMGHKSLDTTALYTQPSEEDMGRAVEKLSVG